MVPGDTIIYNNCLMHTPLFVTCQRKVTSIITLCNHLMDGSDGVWWCLMVCLTWLSPLSPPLVPSLAWSSTGCWKILFSREYDCGVCNGWLALVLIMLLATYDEILENYLVTRWSSLGDNELSWENFFCLCLIGWWTRKRFSCVCRKKKQLKSIFCENLNQISASPNFPIKNLWI